jgi:hypothetical protein
MSIEYLLSLVITQAVMRIFTSFYDSWDIEPGLCGLGFNIYGGR